MIKKVVLLFIFAIPTILNAQEKLSKLKAPSSPASSILGLQPSVILSPKSYQALETALFSNFTNNEGKTLIPNDFALEFTPYWTKNHGLSLLEYLYPQSTLDQFVRNSSFSIASTQNFLLSDSSATNGLSFGYRTTFYFGNKNDRNTVKNKLAELKDNQSIVSGISEVAEELIANNKVANTKEFILIMEPIILKAIFEVDKFDNVGKVTNNIIKDVSLIPPLDMDAPDPFLDSLYKVIDKHLSAEKIFNEFKDYIRNRYGFSVDIAYAGLLNFPANKFEYSYVPKQSFWVTPTYRFEGKFNFLKLMGVLRYEWYNQNYYKKYFKDIDIYENNIDYGLSVATEFEKFEINFELVGRKSKSEIPAGTDAEGNELYRKADKSDLQYLGSFNYNLSGQIVLSYSIGNRFEPILNPSSTLVSTLTLNIGFGTPTESSIDLKK